MYKQNALDAVFNRPMSGLDVNNRFFSYAVAMFIYWMIVSMGLSLGFSPGIFLAQRWRFVGLHILEHGGNIRDAFAASWNMTRGYVLFFIGAACVQWVFLLFCASTGVGLFIGISLRDLMQANMYKKLHLDYDKDLSVCSRES